MNTLATLLLWCVLQVTLVALATIVVYLLARRRGAQLRSTVVLTGLITATLLVPLVWAPWPRWELPRVGEAAVEIPTATPTSDRMHRINGQRNPSGRVEDTNGETSAPPLSVDIQPVTWRTTWNNFVDAIQNPRSPVSPASPASQTTDPPLWPRTVLALFALALATGLARLAGGYWSVRRMIRGARIVQDKRLLEMVDVIRAELSCSSPITVRETHKTATAATTGWQRPVVLLPMNWRDWSDDQLRSVLAHELAHVSRRDYPLGCLAQCALPLHFYHPLWQWLVGRLRLEQELAADALAASIAGGREKYLRNLAELALARSETPVAWPARAFLPTRHTFLRRIEMLRDPKFAGDRSGRLLRVLSVVGLLMVGLVVAGIRPGVVVADGSASENQAVSNQSEGDGAVPEADKVHSQAIRAVAYIPDEALGMVVIHPNRILTDPRLEKNREEIEQAYLDLSDRLLGLLREAGISLENIETVVASILHYAPDRDKQPVVFQFSGPIDRSVIKDAAKRVTSVSGNTVYHLRDHVALMIPEKGILLITEDAPAAAGEPTSVAMVEAAQGDPSDSRWIRLLKELETPVVALLANGEAISESFQLIREQEPRRAKSLDAVTGMAGPLLTETTFAGIGLLLGENKIRIAGLARAKSAAGAKRVAETIQALVTISENGLRQMQQRLDQRENQPSSQAALLIPIANQALASAEITRDGKTVTLKASIAEVPNVLGDLLISIQKARQAAYRARSQNNLKQIALALYMFHEKMGNYPPAVVGVDGVKFSWRVAILPFLGHGDLYEQYQFDEPWNSKHNKKLLAKMPDVYRDPADDSKANSASYYLLTSEHPVTEPMDLNAVTLFTDKPIDLQGGGKGPSIRVISDGASNTILVVEASRNVPWTKPEDIPFDPEKIKDLQKELGGNRPGGFLAAFVDGSVHFIAQRVNPETLKKLITPSGGEVIEDLP